MESLTLENCGDAGKVRWRGPKFNIVFDADGTLTETNSPTWITPKYAHHDQAIADGHCVEDTDDKY